MRYRIEELKTIYEGLINHLIGKGSNKQALIIPFGSFTLKKVASDLDTLIFASNHKRERLKQKLLELEKKMPVKVEIIDKYTKGKSSYKQQIPLQVMVNNYGFAEFLKVSRKFSMKKVEKYKTTRKM